MDSIVVTLLVSMPDKSIDVARSHNRNVLKSVVIADVSVLPATKEVMRLHCSKPRLSPSASHPITPRFSTVISAALVVLCRISMRENVPLTATVYVPAVEYVWIRAESSCAVMASVLPSPQSTVQS